MSISNTNEFWDCGKFDLLFRRKVPDGKGGYAAQKLYRGAFVWGVDPNGNICQIKTHNAAVNKAEMDPYAMTIKAAKWAAGWVPTDGCPQNSQHAERLREAGIPHRESCKSSTDGLELKRDRNGNPHYCKCVEALIVWRREQAAVRAAAMDHKMTLLEQQLKATERQSETMATAAAAAADSSAQLAAQFAEFLKIHNATARATPEPSKGGK
jgi:hypothetical protein